MLGIGRLLKGIGHFLRAIFTKGGANATRAAEAQFTESVDGIKAGFQLKKEGDAKKLKEQYEAVAGLAGRVKELKTELQSITDEEEKLLAQRAILGQKIKAAKEAGNKTEEAKWTEHFTANFNRVKQIDARQAEILAELATKEPELARFKSLLQGSQRAFQNLESREAEAVARFLGAKTALELNAKLNSVFGAQDEFDPTVAIEARVKSLQNQADLAGEMTGVNIEVQKAELETDMANAEAMAALERLIGGDKPAIEAPATEVKTGDGPVRLDS